MTARIALLVVYQCMHVMVLQELLRTAFASEVALIPVGVVLERNGDTLVGLELLRVVEDKLEGGCIRNDLPDCIWVLESGDEMQHPAMGTIEMRYVIIGGREEQTALLKVELDLGGELFILG
jgi:hypothetical protein